MRKRRRPFNSGDDILICKKETIYTLSESEFCGWSCIKNLCMFANDTKATKQKKFI